MIGIETFTMLRGLLNQTGPVYQVMGMEHAVGGTQGILGLEREGQELDTIPQIPTHFKTLPLQMILPGALETQHLPVVLEERSQVRALR